MDSGSKLIHSVVATPANVHDSRVLPDLLHGDETRDWGDSAYTSQQAVLSEVAPAARDFTQAKGSRYRKLTPEERSKNRTKSRVRAKVEYQFGIIKRQFVACALSNLVMAKGELLKRSRLKQRATCV